MFLRGHKESFLLRASQELVGRTVHGLLSVFRGDLILAETNLIFHVDEQREKPRLRMNLLIIWHKLYKFLLNIGS
jgi:hypothetical protein